MTTALVITLFLIGLAIYIKSWVPIVILLVLVIVVIGSVVTLIFAANMEDDT